MSFFEFALFLVLSSVPFARGDVSRDEVTFYYFTDSINNTELYEHNLAVVDVENPIAILIHGWTSESNTTWVEEVTEAYLDTGDYTVITVDYYSVGQEFYLTSVADIRQVGFYVGQLIANLSEDHGASLDNFHVIGHSLGGQVAGFAGKAVQNLTGSSVRRITGLDPAGPFFFPSDPEGRLASTDAGLVVALHTDGLAFGYYPRIGGVDFYANSGISPQPGCIDTLSSRCSHGRATELFLESIYNPDGFLATECDTYTGYLLGLCEGNRQITLGGNLTNSDDGKYYFKTNSDSPYSKQ